MFSIDKSSGYPSESQCTQPIINGRSRIQAILSILNLNLNQTNASGLYSNRAVLEWTILVLTSFVETSENLNLEKAASHCLITLSIGLELEKLEPFTIIQRIVMEVKRCYGSLRERIKVLNHCNILHSESIRAPIIPMRGLVFWPAGDSCHTGRKSFCIMALQITMSEPLSSVQVSEYSIVHYALLLLDLPSLTQGPRGSGNNHSQEVVSRRSD